MCVLLLALWLNEVYTDLYIIFRTANTLPTPTLNNIIHGPEYYPNPAMCMGLKVKYIQRFVSFLER